jgi:hypothetical protein
MGILNFEFLTVESNLENLKPEDFKILDGEVLVISSILQVHCAVKESRSRSFKFSATDIAWAIAKGVRSS